MFRSEIRSTSVQASASSPGTLTGDRNRDCESADVLVIGGGGSGLSAAIEARSLGRSVILVEKKSKLGGTTGMSVGSISASNTPHQLAAGIQDSPQDHFDDMPLFAKKWLPRPDNEALRRLLTENVPDTVRWLMDMGVVFLGPNPEPPHRRPRMHNVLPTSASYIYHLSRRAHRVGVDVRLATQAKQFIVEDGRVVGVVLKEDSGREFNIFARGGVVLASGDFTANPELKAKYISPRISTVQAINPGSTGDGHMMALPLGAKVLNGDVFPFYLRFIAPTRRKLVQRVPPWRIVTHTMNWAIRNVPEAILRPFLLDFLTTFLSPAPQMFTDGAILVNSKGERFTQEGKDTSSALVDQPGHTCFIIFDQDLAHKYSRWPHFISTAPGIGYAYFPDYKRSRKDIFFQANTVAELARKLKVSVSTLEGTLLGEGKHSDGTPRTVVTRAPFYALGPVKILLTLADGGLDVTDRLQVKGHDGKPIPGLFAAGSVGQGGLLLEGHGHHLGWAFTSGRLAGRYAANQAVSQSTSV